MNKIIIELSDNISIEGYILFKAYMYRRFKTRNDEEMWGIIRNMIKRDQMDIPEIISIMDTVVRQNEEIIRLKSRRKEPELEKTMDEAAGMLE